MSPRQAASLPSYFPYVLGAAALLAASLILYNVTSPPPKPRLHRSNARRRANRTTNPLPLPAATASALQAAGHSAQTRRGAQDSPDTNQNLLTLLYTIAVDQATRESYVHRGVTCNHCGTLPIRGIRYRCTNCEDFDLCENCEGDETAHSKTHLFYKIRIPAPWIGSGRQGRGELVYPGWPALCPVSLPTGVVQRLSEASGWDAPELEALYEQFKVLAATVHEDTQYGINAAISRATFDRCFLPNASSRDPHPAAPSLVYDRMFAFYDANRDGLIDFGEFVIGVACTNTKERTPARLRRIFAGYDLDNDGLVSRSDMLRLFRAFYALSRDMVCDVVASEELYDSAAMATAAAGRQPISAAFTAPIGASTRLVKPSSAVTADEDPDDAVLLPDIPADLSKEPAVIAKKNEGCDAVDAQRRALFWEEDGGAEVLEQLSLLGMNELLDRLFAAKERALVQTALETGSAAVEALRRGEASTRDVSLSYEEFEAVVLQADRAKMDFVSMWTDLASF